jgi:hypothetical protein
MRFSRSPRRSSDTLKRALNSQPKLAPKEWHRSSARRPMLMRWSQPCLAPNTTHNTRESRAGIASILVANDLRRVPGLVLLATTSASPLVLRVSVDREDDNPDVGGLVELDAAPHVGGQAYFRSCKRCVGGIE